LLPFSPISIQGRPLPTGGIWGHWWRPVPGGLPAGGKLWRLKHRFAGKERRLALGIYPATPYVFVTERKGPLTTATVPKLVARAIQHYMGHKNI